MAAFSPEVVALLACIGGLCVLGVLGSAATQVRDARLKHDVDIRVAQLKMRMAGRYQRAAQHADAEIVVDPIDEHDE